MPGFENWRDKRRLLLQQTFRESVTSIRLVGRRALLALLGIAVGCAAVVALLNIGHNAANEAISTFKGLGTNNLVASYLPHPGTNRPGPDQVNVEVAKSILPEVNYIAPLSMHSARLIHTGRASDATVVGTTSGLASVLGLPIENGRFLSSYDRYVTYVVVGARVARELGHPNRSLQLGDRLPIEGYLFEVIGIASSLPRNVLVPVVADDSVFIPIEGMRRLRPSPEINSIIARIHDVPDLSVVARSLKRFLSDTAGGREVEVQIPQQLLDGLSRQAKTFSYLLAGLGGISLLVGGVGVMNVMLMSIAERRREIGIRMALGARSSDIRNLFLMEAAILSTLGALIGATVGVGAAYIFVYLSGWLFTLAPLSLPLGMISAFIVGIFFGLHPALSAARLQPVQALRDD
ncbi:ABC transporter permease [Phytopseudomonas daroniae]|uniref:ABC transporter permease n=1 Tax=Phytopseudomonas daroniae TaxID=2487519 RepID=UPI0010383BA2|nr:ABC transporter permease [Pseudomonas daroniae]TBU74001.1 ABC transporter permease [Pseudomonas daroniae]